MTDRWVVVVEESISLLKDNKVQAAIDLLEALLPKEESDTPRKSKKKAKAISKSKSKEEKEQTPTKSEDKSKEQKLNKSTEKKSEQPVKERKLSKSKVQSLQDFVTDESRKGLARSEKQEKAWGYIVNELYSTERDYLRDVHILIDIFRNPMLKQNLITPAESTKIFSNIDMILAVNEELLKQLESINKGKADFSDVVKKPAKLPESLTKADLQNFTAVMKVVIREENDDTVKSLKIDGVTTLADAIKRIKRKLSTEVAQTYDLYHENGKLHSNLALKLKK